jgi:hypothetical protein
MRNNRTEFTDAQKAAIYRRDRATCCFSGANLWLFDAPLRYGWQSDWVDHKKPSSRGGGSDPNDNGVCASHTFNMKKRNNGADTAYLFEEGHPTWLYYSLFGSPPPQVVERLKKLGQLNQADWYFNRGVTWVFQALDSKWAENDHTRTSDYWFKAAFRKFETFRKIRDKLPGYSSLEDRGFVSHPDETQETLIRLSEHKSLEPFKLMALRLLPQYKRNSNVWWNYFSINEEKDCSPKTRARRREKAYKAADRIRDRLTGETFEGIQADYQIRCAGAEILLQP